MEGDHAYLKESLIKWFVWFRKVRKLQSMYFKTFSVLERVGLVYEVELPFNYYMCKMCSMYHSYGGTKPIHHMWYSFIPA